jgi:hypothetical protein
MKGDMKRETKGKGIMACYCVPADTPVSVLSASEAVGYETSGSGTWMSSCFWIRSCAGNGRAKRVAYVHIPRPSQGHDHGCAAWPIFTLVLHLFIPLLQILLHVPQATLHSRESQIVPHPACRDTHRSIEDVPQCPGAESPDQFTVNLLDKLPEVLL